MTRGARGVLVMLVMGRWKAQGGSRVGSEFKRKLDPSSFGDLLSVRLVLSDRLSLGSWLG